MDNKKFYQVEKEINGVTYIAQFNGLSAALQALDDSYISGTSNISQVKLAKHILENVIVEPKGLAVDNFDNVDSFNEVIKFGTQVMYGKLRPSGESKEN